MSRLPPSTIIGKTLSSSKARIEFAGEYVTPSGRLVSDSQTAYALAICFDLVSPWKFLISNICLIRLSALLLTQQRWH
jgi:hypothetical protein